MGKLRKFWMSTNFKTDDVKALIEDVWLAFKNNPDIETQDCFNGLSDQLKDRIIWSKDFWNAFEYFCNKAKTINRYEKHIIAHSISPDRFTMRNTYNHYYYVCCEYIINNLPVDNV